MDEVLRFKVRATLPLHPDGVRYELRHGMTVLHAAEVARNPPVIASAGSGGGDSRLEVHWHGDNSSTLSYNVVALMHSGRRLTLARGLSVNAYTIDLKRMPVPGKGTVYVEVSDGVRSSQIEAGTFDVTARPPTLHILAPAADTRLPYGQPISVVACCLDMGGRPCTAAAAEWSLDGERFAEGTFIAAIDNAAPGSHVLTLAYRDELQPPDCVLRFDVDEVDEDHRRWAALMHNDALAADSDEACSD